MSVGDNGASWESARFDGLAGSTESFGLPTLVGAESSDTLEELADFDFSPAGVTAAQRTHCQHSSEIGKQLRGH